MKVACVGYRDWALNIYQSLVSSQKNIEFLIQSSEASFSEAELNEFSPDLILFYGWSWKVPETLVRSYRCLMLHPSRLPEYRGGSPIQNQIRDGLLDSATTIFLMDEGLDSGPICKQRYLSLAGNLSDILKQIEFDGYEMTVEIFLKGLNPITQDHSKATYCKRLHPRMSEITLEELKNSSSKELYNKIRMLQDPYPNPFIKTADGRKLIIKSCEVAD